MEAAKTIEEYQAQIAAIRMQAHKRRSEAWAMVPETVLGIELNPITPAIHSLLVGTGNAYFTGRIPKENDLRNFVWFCSPQFNPDTPLLSSRWKAWQMGKLNIAMRRGKEKTKAERIIANFYRASLQIIEIRQETFRNGAPPTESEEPAVPLAASLEAQMLDMFAREYQQWPLPKPVRHTPIKQLYQLARCIDRRLLGARAGYHDSDENDCTRNFLTGLNPRN